MPRESVDFLRQNQQTIVIEPEPVQFYLLDQAAQESRVIFLGESHGVTINEDLDFALFKYLYETAGVRTYIAETGYSMGHYINQYVQGGDEVLLRNSYAALEGTLGWNQSRFAFWQRVYAWNQTLPESERVRVVGLDVEHQYPVGVSHVFDLLPDGETPAGFSEPVAVLRTMVEERSWNSQDCLSAVDALLGELDAQPDVALAYLGDNLNELSLTLQSIQYGFEYYAIDDWRAASVTRDQRIYETYLALGLEQETVYGKWGRDHIYQAQYRSIDYIAQLLDTIDSPVAGQVLSISLIYADSTQLNIRNGQYRQSRLAAPRRIVGPLRRATDADVTLFRLTGAASPFDDALYLVDHPTGGGVTTDYMQFVMLVQGAEAATPLDE